MNIGVDIRNCKCRTNLTRIQGFWVYYASKGSGRQAKKD